MEKYLRMRARCVVLLLNCIPKEQILEDFNNIAIGADFYCIMLIMTHWNAFVAAYRSSHPGATMQQCSVAYRGKKGGKSVKQLNTSLGKDIELALQVADKRKRSEAYWVTIFREKNGTNDSIYSIAQSTSDTYTLLRNQGDGAEDIGVITKKYIVSVVLALVKENYSNDVVKVVVGDPSFMIVR